MLDMSRNRFGADGGEPLRSKILRVVNDAGVPEAAVLKALAYCRAQFENRRMVERIVRKCGLQTSRFITNEHLELYFDIARGKRELGYISKGWDDPGFRVGDVVMVPQPKVGGLREHGQMFMRFCATRGVAMTSEKNDGGGVELQLESVIYSDGFNKKVVGQVLDCLVECTEEARRLLCGE